MRRFIAAATNFLLLAAVCEAGETVQVGGVNYLLRSGLRRSEFNLKLQAKMEKSGGNPTVCVLLNYADSERHYRAEIGWNGSRLFRVEGGMAIPIGRGSSDGLPESGKAEIVIKRRSTLLAIVVNGRVVSQAYDDLYSRGKIGVGVKGSGINITKLTRQPFAKVVFMSDFMKHSKEAKSFVDIGGTWEVRTLENPARSANAFSYVGKGTPAKPAGSVSGGWSWDDYEFNVSARHTGGRIGIYFYYRDTKNYYLFRWGPRGSKVGRKELIKCRNGKRTVVARAKGGYILRQWYRLGAEILDGVAVVLIDGHEVLRHHDRDLAFGKIGLYTEDPVGTTFDDVYVAGKRFLDDDFSGEPILWQELGGKWHLTGEGTSRAYASTSTGPAKVIAGDVRWRDYTLAADLTPPKRGAAGLCLHYLDEVNHYWVRLEADGTLKLGRIIETRRKLLAETTLPDELAGKPMLRLSASYSDGIIRVAAADRTLIEVWDASITTGKVGLLNDSSEVKFDNVRVDFPETPHPVLTYNRVFKTERSMQGWAAPQSDWLASRFIGPEAGDSNTQWHRGDFFGDVDLDTALKQPEAEAWTASLLISADRPQPDRGYRLQLVKSSPMILRLLRAGEEVMTKKLEGEGIPKRVKLSRRGRFVFGYLDDELKLHFRDDAPLRGSMIAVRENGATFVRDDMKVTCPNVSSFTFSQAPSDWRVAGGEWEVAKRWECDKRWSWFRGGSKSGIAAIWHKGHFAGDVTVEFCAAVQMDSKRGRGYSHARDMNATICSDGRDMTSGYAFMLGGYGNTLTCITRNGKIVASTKGITLPASISMHRQWWYVKIDRKGPRLRFFVDNKLILEYLDPEPLTGDRVALWTYKDALMVARVRVSAENTSKFEQPDFDPPATSKCIYDLP